MITLAVGIPIGLLAGRYRDGPIDFGGRMFGIIIYAAPVFFLGFLAQLWSLRARVTDVGPREPDRRVRARQDRPTST